MTGRQDLPSSGGKFDRIAQREAHAKADGTVTAKERARLQHQQNKASRKIRHNKHDAQKSG